MEEFQAKTDPFLADTDGDGLSDYAEKNFHSTDPTQADPDGDGFSDQEELAEGTDPSDPTRYPNWDWGTKTYYSSIRGTDAGGSEQQASGCNVFSSIGSGNDGVWNENSLYLNINGRFALSHSPSFSSGDYDVDADGMPDRWELANGFDITLNDSAVDADGDGLSNLQEYALNTNPQEADSDGDGLNDYQEVNDLETDPNEPDSDGDGFDDGVESSNGEDPNDASSYPGDDEYAGRFSEKRSVINAASGWKTSLDGSLSSFGLSGQAIAGIITENATIENRSGWVSTIEVQSQNPVDQDTDGDGLLMSGKKPTTLIHYWRMHWEIGMGMG